MTTYLGRPSNDTDANRAFGVNGHHGTDWGWGQGDAVYAMADGVVSEARELSDYGWIIRIDHGILCGPVTETRYCHLLAGSLAVKVNDSVKRGQPIARMGNTGSLIPVIGGVKAKHLHSELFLAGVRVDEQPYQRKEIPVMAANDRTVRSDIRAIVRADTSTTAAQVGLLPINSTHAILGWKRGQAVTAHGITTDAWGMIAKDQWVSMVGFTNTSTAGITDLNPVVVPGTGATRAEVEAIVKASEARLLAAAAASEARIAAQIAGVPKAVDDLQKTAGH